LSEFLLEKGYEVHGIIRCSSVDFRERIAHNENTSFHPYSLYAMAKLYEYWIIKEHRKSYNMYCCSGILFNHESERRGDTSVTRKITLAAARIAAGKQNKFIP